MIGNDFTISSRQSEIALLLGTSASYTISATSTGNPGTIALAATGAPPGVTVAFTPFSAFDQATHIATATMTVTTVTTSSGGIPGKFALAVTGSNGSQSKGTAVSLIIAGRRRVLLQAATGRPL